ncbi:unnamed protein product [Owenia fusiformis]|uniref:Uncharacterized protein n=1 Tax=Owenia fusiformis TaxID=6347 RepID=A0A8S4PGZ2_OWEFU|nr:unnamed protein product [Owenia fusiformis]
MSASAYSCYIMWIVVLCSVEALEGEDLDRLHFCPEDDCCAPFCRCPSFQPPGELPVESTPQFVLLTVNGPVLNTRRYQQLFVQNFTNPNGAPIHGTFFVPLDTPETENDMVCDIYKHGHEIAVYLDAQVNTKTVNRKGDNMTFRSEFQQQQNLFEYHSGILHESIAGIRISDAHVDRRTIYDMAHDLFEYDSSYLSTWYDRLNASKPLWPFTMDYTPGGATGSHPGLWQVPIATLLLNNSRESMTPVQIYHTLTTGFLQHYKHNRAPFVMSIDSQWLNDSDELSLVLALFLTTLEKLNNVWCVSIHQMLQWMQSPISTSELMQYQPWEEDAKQSCI